MRDPDLEIEDGVWGGGGGGHPDPKIKGGRSQKNVFRPFGSQFGLKIRGRPAPRTPPLDLLLIYNTNRMLSSENSTEIYYSVTKLLLIKEIPGTAIYGEQSSFQVKAFA